MATTQSTIVRELKRCILRRELNPGDRLPSRRALRHRFDASPVTIQAAINRLMAEGFVTVGARKHGTRVAARPPHLHHYKLLFPFGPELQGEFWQRLRDEAQRAGEESEREFSCFYGLGGHQDIQAYTELVQAVHSQCVAGLIFVSGAAEFAGTPILEQPGIPRVAIAPEYQHPGIPRLCVDYESFFRLAVDHLLAQGRSRIAVVFGASPNDDDSEIVRLGAGVLAARGLEMKPRWTQFVHLWSPLAARRCVHLLLHDGQSERPDGLIVADDNCLPAVTAGVVDAAVRVPDELSIVTLANFPATVPAAVPVTRIGFDVRAILEDLTCMIDAQRDGQVPPQFRLVTAVREADYLRANAATESPTPNAGVP